MLRDLLRNEYQGMRRVPMPLRRRLDLWRRGFSSESGVLFGLPENDPSRYLSDVARMLRTPFINGIYNPILFDKLIFYHTMRSLTTPTPHLYGIVTQAGRIAWIHPPFAPAPGVDGLMAVLERTGAAVLKPLDGGRGDRVRFVTYDGVTLTLNGQASDERSLREALEPDTLICERAQQGAYAERIFAGSTNTVRAITMWDYEADEPFIAAAEHRFGTHRSAPVDNWAQGGVSTGLDTETGVLGPAILQLESGTLQWTPDHPDTHERIEGVQVPGWPAVSEALLRVSRQLAHIPYIGWDVLVGDDDFTVIEGNSYPGVMIQVHTPMLTDPRVRAFYRHHGVLLR